MARWEFKLPDIGEGVSEGEIVAWHVKQGDEIREDDPMVDVMTDKATVTITSPRAGKILETRGEVGSVVAVHGVLVVFDLAGTSEEPAATAVDASAHGQAGHANGNGASKTGKTEPAPTVLLDIPGGTYWESWRAFVESELAGRAYVGKDDLELVLGLGEDVELHRVARQAGSI